MMNSLLGGRYQLGQMIGTGGMADVYIAQDQRALTTQQLLLSMTLEKSQLLT